MIDPSDSLLEPGTMLAHYRLRVPIGAGAMGRVYEAYDTSLDRTVAVKVLNPEISGQEETVTRFVREARAAARVNHPNLVHIYFVGEEDEKNRRWFAMEFVPGKTLEELVESEGPLPLDRAIGVLVQACRGLAAAHEAGVIHRDIKPSNLKLLPDGNVKVMDFGLAKSLEAEVDVTGAGRIMGTPRYMSPEQCRGETVDWRTDLYSVGLLAWYLIAGRQPWSGNIGQIIDAQMNRPLPPLSEARADLSPAVQRTLDRFCAKDPADRAASMAEAIRQLEALRPRYLDLAPLAARIFAFLIDLVVFGFLYGALFTGLTLVLSSPELVIWGVRIGGVALLYLSQAGMERWVGASLGKLALNLRVVGQDGRRPGLGPLSIRFLARFPYGITYPLYTWSPKLLWVGWGLQLLAILAGLACFLAFRRRTVSDLVTRTRVVYHQAAGGRERTTEA